MTTKELEYCKFQLQKLITADLDDNLFPPLCFINRSYLPDENDPQKQCVTGSGSIKVVMILEHF